MYAMFLDSDGIVVWAPVSEHTSVAGIFYKEKVLISYSELHYKAPVDKCKLTPSVT